MDDVTEKDRGSAGQTASWRRFLPFAAFTTVFAVLAAYVFWGCWSTAVTFVAPDDPIVFYTAFGDVFMHWLNGFLTTGRIQPTDILWSGLLGSPLFCRELKYAVAVYLAALGMVYFLRGRGLSNLASYGAGLFLAFCGYWFTLYSAGHGGWFVWMSYGVFVFGLIDRAVEGGRIRHWLLLGTTAAWGSYYQADLWLIFTAFSGAYFVFRAICARPGWKRLVRGSAFAASAFFLVGAPSFHQALTGALVGRDKQIAESKGSALSGGAGVDDAEARWIFVTNWSLPPSESAEFFIPRLNGDTSCPMTLSLNFNKGLRPYAGAIGRPYKAEQGNYRQHSVYVGWVTCLMALLGVVSLFSRRSSTVVFFLSAAVVFWLFSMGRYCEPVYRLVYHLPFGDYLRGPVKWHHLTEFCICALSGFGIAALLSWLGSISRGNVRRLLFFRCAVAALILAGVADLAIEARRFCAPVDYGRAVRSKCSSQLTVLTRQQLQDPQIAEMVRQGYILSVANWLGDPNAYLVQALKPLKSPRPAVPKPLPLTLGVISLLSAAAVVIFSFWNVNTEEEYHESKS